MPTQPKLPPTSEVFVVHGHDDGARLAVTEFLKAIGLIPVVIMDRARSSRTIIEQIERHSNVAYAVIVMTPDDLGKAKDFAGPLQARARQNVIFEHGFFMGKLGRDRTCAILAPPLEKPSDIDGILYIALDDAGRWKTQLLYELEEAKLPVDELEFALRIASAKDAKISYELRPNEHVVDVKLTGEIDGATEGGVISALVSYAVKRKKSIVLDFTEVVFIDTGALAKLIKAQAIVANAGHAMLIFGMNNHIKHVLEITRLDTILRQCASRGDAIRIVADRKETAVKAGQALG